MAQTSDFYAVLGVARTADEREIKKAYFRLVRHYPPESHPEEFKRVREAYEVLQDPASRREYDNVTQYGEEIGQHLRAGTEAMERGDLAAAQDAFRHVLSQKEDLHFARDLLGMAYLNNNQPREALKHFELLLSAAEPSATYLLHKGYAHYALDQYQDAIAAYLRARELDPADTRILVALADCYTAIDNYEQALIELDRAIHAGHAGGAPDFQDFVFFMRKVQIQLLRDRTDLAEGEIDQIFKILPPDPEVRKYVAQKLASLASQLFRIKRSADGNRILRRAQQLHTRHKGAPFVFPARATQKIADLPPESREQIERLAREPAPHKLTHGVWGGPVLLGLFALVVLFGSLWQAATATEEWHGNSYFIMVLMLLGAPALLLSSLQRLRRIARSKVGRFTTIHPLYLLQVEVDRVTAWPLVNLHDVSMTHHLQNGVYQYTAVKADFAGINLTLTIRGQQASVDWAQSLLDARHRCLGLMAVGMLDEEEGFDILPPEMLEGKAGRAEPRARWRSAQRYALAAAAGVALAAGGTVMNTSAAERAVWQRATTYPRAHGFRLYLSRYPQGNHAAEARGRLSQIYEEAKERYLQQVGDAPGKQAIVDVLDALKEAPTQEVWVRYTASVDMGPVQGQRLGDGTLPIQPDRAFTEAVNRQREAAITQSLSSAFQKVLAQDVLSLLGHPAAGGGGRYLRRGVREQVPPAVTFDVAYQVTPSGELYRSTTDKSALYGIQLSWTLTINTPKTRAQGGQPYSIRLISQPARSIRYVKSSFEDDEVLPYTKMAESAFEEFGRKVAGEFGVTIPAAGRGGAVDGQQLSPTVRRMLADIARRKNLSPAVLEDILRHRAE